MVQHFHQTPAPSKVGRQLIGFVKELTSGTEEASHGDGDGGEIIGLNMEMNMMNMERWGDLGELGEDEEGR